jgi:hypothetical protein
MEIKDIGLTAVFMGIAFGLIVGLMFLSLGHYLWLLGIPFGIAFGFLYKNLAEDKAMKERMKEKEKEKNNTDDMH